MRDLETNESPVPRKPTEHVAPEQEQFDEMYEKHKVERNMQNTKQEQDYHIKQEQANKVGERGEREKSETKK